MTLSTAQLKALAIKLVALTPPPLPEDEHERALVVAYRQLGDEGRQRAAGFMSSLREEELGIAQEPWTDDEIESCAGAIMQALRERMPDRPVNQFLAERFAESIRMTQAEADTSRFMARYACGDSGLSR